MQHKRSCLRHAVSLVSVLLCSGSAFLCASGLAERPPEPLPIEIVLSALESAFCPVSLSANGRWLAYTVRNPRKAVLQDLKHPRQFTDSGVPVIMVGTDVWMTDTQSGQSKNLTNGQGNNWGPSWSPNGRYLAFYSDRDGSERLWVYDSTLNTLRRLSKELVHPFWPTQIPMWTADDANVLVKLLPEGMTVGETENLIRSRERESKSTKDSQPDSTVKIYKASSSPPHNFFTNAESADLASIEIKSGTAKRIAKQVNPVWYAASPDNSGIAFATMKGQVKGNGWRNLFDLIVVSADGKMKIIADNIQERSSTMVASWSPDSRSLSYTDSGEGTIGDCYIGSTQEIHPRKCMQAPHPNFSADELRPPVWDASGQNLYFLVSWALWQVSIADGVAKKVAEIPDHKMVEIVAPYPRGRFSSPDAGRTMIVETLGETTRESGFYRIDLHTGMHQKIIEEDRMYGPEPYIKTVATEQANAVTFVAQDSNHPPDFWILGSQPQSLRQVTQMNPDFTRYSLGQSRLIEWTSLNGDVLHGALLLPADFHVGMRYPLVVWVYPVMQSYVLNAFGLFPHAAIDNMQLLASRGYAVLLPDAPIRIGTPMRDLVSAVLPGVNRVIELGIADASRIGIMGESSGGYSTLALIVQTTRFRAAIMRAGFGDLVANYGEMNEDGSSYGLGILENSMLGGTPWQYRERYIENSPIFQLDKVQTPLLIVHGTNDVAVSPFLAGEVFVGLQRLSKEVVYAQYQGEGHGISSYSNQFDYCNRMIAWFDKYLKVMPSQEGLQSPPQ